MIAPTLGVLGAVFGLIAAMSYINDTEAMAEAIAVAFIANILGIFTVLWNPFEIHMSIKKKMKHSEEEGGEAWLLPYSDLMTLLLAVFIVLFAVTE